MHVGAVSVLEGAPFFDADGRFRIDEVRDLVLSRLPLMPRFRRRLMSVPYDQGRPIWVDDDRFDITYHVRHTALPRPGSWEQLVALDDARPGGPARPRAPAVGDLVGRRARGRQRRAAAEDAPRADRRRLGRRRRDAAARHEPDYVAAGRSRVDARARAEPVAAAARHAARARHRTGRDRAFGAVDVARAAPRARARARAHAVDEHDGHARRDRAAHVDQRAHRPASPARGRAGAARRRQGDPARARRHRQRRRARGRGRRAAPAVRCTAPTTPKTCSCACCARCRCAPTTNAARSATRSRRCSSTCRSTTGPRSSGCARSPRRPPI